MTARSIHASLQVDEDVSAEVVGAVDEPCDAEAFSREELVSIVMPCHNGMPFLRSAIQSVLAQTHSNLELLVVDDSSTDGSAEWVREVAAADPRVCPLRTANGRGAAAARNTGIDAANGRFVAFLDADDVWLRDKLARQLAFMREQQVAFTWCPYVEIDHHGNRRRTVASWARCSTEDLLDKKTVMGCSTVIYDRQLFGRQLMPDIRMRQDLGLWLRLLRMSEERGLRAQGVDDPLVLYRVHNGSLSSSKLRAAWYQWRLLREVEALDRGSATLRFIAYAWRSVVARL